MIRIFCLFIAACLMPGCGGAPEPSEADAEAAAAGVGNENQVRFFIAEAMQLTRLDLTHTGQGNFTAKGTDADGMTYDIIIEQLPSEISYTWTDAKGRKGQGKLAH